MDTDNQAIRTRFVTRAKAMTSIKVTSIYGPEPAGKGPKPPAMVADIIPPLMKTTNSSEACDL